MAINIGVRIGFYRMTGFTGFTRKTFVPFSRRFHAKAQTKTQRTQRRVKDSDVPEDFDPPLRSLRLPLRLCVNLFLKLTNAGDVVGGSDSHVQSGRVVLNG